MAACRPRGSIGAWQEMIRHNFIVPDINCEHCSKTIQSAIAGLEDVKLVEVDVSAKRVTVAGEPALDEIAAAIEKAGYQVEAVFQERSSSVS
jgi:copper chaperone